MKNPCQLHDVKTEMKSTNNKPDDWTGNVRKCKIDNPLELNAEQRNVAESPVLPSHLQDFGQKKAFACSKNDVGTCTLIKHRIETAGAAPVGQPLRRTPLGFDGEELQNLKE